MKKPKIRPVPAVMRTINILKYLSENPEPVGVSRLAKALGIVPSTCLHILRALADEGLVAVNTASKQYTLGAGILMLARSYLSESNVVRVVQPILDDLTRQSGVTSVFVEPYGSRNLITTAVGESAEMFSVRIIRGLSFPRFASASGRCVAAYCGLGPEDLKAKFNSVVWENAPTFDEWLQDVNAVKQCGYAIDDGAYVHGVTIVAVPVLNNTGKQLKYCIACASLAGQLSGQKLDELILDLKAGAKSFETRLIEKV